MKEFFKDYKEMCIDPQNKWMKKHWKGYILMCLILWGGTAAFCCKDMIKESIKNRKTEEDE